MKFAVLSIVLAGIAAVRGDAAIDAVIKLMEGGMTSEQAQAKYLEVATTAGTACGTEVCLSESMACLAVTACATKLTAGDIPGVAGTGDAGVAAATCLGSDAFTICLESKVSVALSALSGGGGGGVTQLVTHAAAASNFEMTGNICEADVNFYWIYQGNTANGYGYYKDAATGNYLHHDVDCNGPENDGYYATGEAALWIVTNLKPSTTRTTDLDNSGDCSVIAAILTTSDIPESGTWSATCRSPDGYSPGEGTLIVRDIGQQTAPLPQPTTSNFKMSGFLCEAIEYYWIYQGNTANGYGYYKDVATGRYLHYDEDCNGPENDGYGQTGASPFWIVTSLKPSTTRTTDLDNSGDCSTFISTPATSYVYVPESGEWSAGCAYSDGSFEVESATLTVRDIGENTAPTVSTGWRGETRGAGSSASSVISSVALACAFLGLTMFLA